MQSFRPTLDLLNQIHILLRESLHLRVGPHDLTHVTKECCWGTSELEEFMISSFFGFLFHHGKEILSHFGLPNVLTCHRFPLPQQTPKGWTPLRSI